MVEYMFVQNILFCAFLSLIQTDSVSLAINDVDIIDNSLSINFKLENTSSNPIVVYKPALESMIDGMLIVELIGQRDEDKYHDLYPFEVMRDLDRIYLTASNAVLLRRGQSYESNIKVPLEHQKGKFNLRLTLNYSHVNFELKYPFSTENVFRKVLQTEKKVEI